MVLREHGVNILLNIFCGPVVNAARGITSQVTNAVTLFVNNFMQAVNPQITKFYSSGDLKEMHRLIFKSSRFSFYLMLILSFPLMKGIDYALGIWLISVPEHTVSFIQLLMVFCLMDTLMLPLITGLLAEGNIRIYEIVLTALNLCIIAFSYIALKFGYAPESVYVIPIVVEISIIACRIWLSNKAYHLPIKRYFREVLYNVFIVSLVAGTLVWWLQLPIKDPLTNFIIEELLALSISFLTVCILGLTLNERLLLAAMIRKVMKIR